MPLFQAVPTYKNLVFSVVKLFIQLSVDLVFLCSKPGNKCFQVGTLSQQSIALVSFSVLLNTGCLDWFFFFFWFLLVFVGFFEDSRFQYFISSWCLLNCRSLYLLPFLGHKFKTLHNLCFKILIIDELLAINGL